MGRRVTVPLTRWDAGPVVWRAGAGRAAELGRRFARPVALRCPTPTPLPNAPSAWPDPPGPPWLPAAARAVRTACRFRDPGGPTPKPRVSATRHQPVGP